jgi:hypothetical protein
LIELEIAHEISHLSEEQIEELYARYLAGEKNSSLIEFYNIDIHPNKLIRILPPIKREDKMCPYCLIAMYSRRKGKSSHSWNTPPMECLSCQHEEYDNGPQGKMCSCDNCNKNRQEQEQEMLEKSRGTIASEYRLDRIEPYAYSDLTFIHKLVLLTMFKIQTEESFEYIQSIDDPQKTVNLSPTTDMDIELVTSLFRQNVIVVDPASKLSAFSEENDYKSFYPSSVQWIVNVSIEDEVRASLAEIFHVLYNEFLAKMHSSWEEQFHDLTYKLAREEVMQYLAVKVEELKLNFTAEKKTREVVTTLLDSFSVSEIYYFAKNAVESAHVYYSKGFSRGKKHAANTIPGKMLQLGERAISESWDTYKYGRDSRAPRSAISAVLYDLLLQGDDEGFTCSPGIYWKQELVRRYWPVVSDVEDTMACQVCGSLNISSKMSDNVIVIECNDCSSSVEYSSS